MHFSIFFVFQDLSYLYGREDRYYEEAVPFQRYRNSIKLCQSKQKLSGDVIYYKNLVGTC